MATGPPPEPPMAYRIEFTHSAARELRKLRGPIVRRIGEKIDALGRDPRPSNCEPIRGGEPGTVRIRVGDYRIIYQIRDDVLVVLVLKVAHRRDVYRDL